MAKINYGFEKRRRDQIKKQKQDAKRQRKENPGPKEGSPDDYFRDLNAPETPPEGEPNKDGERPE